MRSDNVPLASRWFFPVGKPDQNGVQYTQDAVKNALKLMRDPLPIVDLKNDGTRRVIGVTTSKPYAVQWDEEASGFRFTVDGRILFAGTECVVNSVNTAGEITSFSITGFGISE